MPTTKKQNMRVDLADRQKANNANKFQSKLFQKLVVICHLLNDFSNNTPKAVKV